MGGVQEAASSEERGNLLPQEKGQPVSLAPSYLGLSLSPFGIILWVL